MSERKDEFANETEDGQLIVRFPISNPLAPFTPSVFVRDIGFFECEEAITLRDISIMLYQMTGSGVTNNLARELSERLRIEAKYVLKALSDIVDEYRTMDYIESYKKAFPISFLGEDEE